MPIPREILNVPRPKNTVVIAYGRDKKLYAVRQRVGCRNVGGRHLPVNGPTIGHIVDGAYVPIAKSAPQDVSLSPIDLKDWASVVLCDRLFKSIQDELFAVYSQSDAMKIYYISLLRVCDKGIRDFELKEEYETSFLSELYPDVSLSKNTVSTFLNDLGKTMSRIVTFMRNRTASVSLDHHLLVDGTLKSDEPKVNSLSQIFPGRPGPRGQAISLFSSRSIWKRWNRSAPSAFPEICWMPLPTKPSSRKTRSPKGSSLEIKASRNPQLTRSLKTIRICITLIR